MSNSSQPSDADVRQWMQTLAAESPKKGSLPDPHLLWLKARLEERAELNERALRPIAIAEKIAVAIFALLGSAGMLAVAQHAETWFAQAGEPDIFAWAVAGVCFIAIGFAFILKPLLSGD
ncbi:MAG: hypothetical protein OXB98_19640 [Bryobacterales bacterium]|nr:hypothetical protein [Bryobacterales bacterium]